MKKSKFSLFVLLGALSGGAISFLHEPTREAMRKRAEKAISTVQYYRENKDQLKIKMENEKNKYKNLFEHITEDAMFIKDKIEDFKILTPQVKELIDQTKDALQETKEDFKEIVDESSHKL